MQENKHHKTHKQTNAKKRGGMKGHCHAAVHVVVERYTN